jgi:hypothetical protein
MDPMRLSHMQFFSIEIALVMANEKTPHSVTGLEWANIDSAFHSIIILAGCFSTRHSIQLKLLQLIVLATMLRHLVR